MDGDASEQPAVVLIGGPNGAGKTTTAMTLLPERNFFKLYRPLADTWVLCDNSTSELVAVALGGRNLKTMVFRPESWSRIERTAAGG